MRKLRIGMVGAGYMGQIAHLSNYAEIEQCELVALAELRPELRAKIATRYGISQTFENHQQLLDEADVDAVVAVTQRPFTGPVALDCLSAGKHVLTEKPMAGTLEQGQRLVRAAEEHGVTYAVGYMKRFDEGVQKAKELLDELIETQELGPIIFARAHCFMGDSFCNAAGHVSSEEKITPTMDGWPIAPEWVPPERQLDFAAYLNTYSHNINLLRYLLGTTPKPEYVNFKNMAGRIAALNFGDFIATLETGRSNYH